MEDKLQEPATEKAEDVQKIPYCILMKEFKDAADALSAISTETQGDVTITVTARGGVTATIKGGTNLFSKPQTFRLENI